MQRCRVWTLLAVTASTAILPLTAQQPATPPPQTPPAQTSPTPAQPATAPPIAAQSVNNGTYTITRNARIVILDMVVTDSKGNIVTDLRKEDFHVTEMNEPQVVLNFEAAGAHVTPPSDDITSTQQLDQIAPRAPVNIVLLDEFNTRFEDMAFARYSLKKFLERQPGKLATPTMLIAVDLQHFTVLHDYTQNKDELIAALDHHFAAYPWQVHQYGWLSERYATAFITLRRVAQAVIGHPGHKNMIWIGRGFPSLNMANFPVDTANRVNNAVQDCVNTLRDARVTLYTIDPAGLMMDPGKYGSDAAFVDPFGGNYQFSKLATATGGKALYGRNDVDQQIGTAIRDGAAFYTLTYRPGDSSASPQKFRRIKVTVDRPGMTVTTREGYYLAYGPGRVDPQKPSQRLVTDLLSAEGSTMVYDGVPLTLTRMPGDAEHFDIHVDEHALYWTPATDTEPRHTEVILIASTFDKKNKEIKRDAKSIRIPATGNDVPPTGHFLRGIDFKYTLAHDPKAVRARFVIRVTASGRIGTADVDLTKPPPAS
ncbi:MAG: VWA domain-containing protein [Edaphobacter sp.]|uniref:VWA domain-containing protein n=1 Tax=Edaphobacter sp. TaxID=1934404 RepID=UPI00238913A0|nr:VWA domain-containing protein [Edaphobacter sp.]MDE1176862.1 VWA domain-containing protein [Edaphobacter sp.]